jgi:hypothetical protein
MSQDSPRRVNCPECGLRVTVKRAVPGKRVTCPGCAAEFRVPQFRELVPQLEESRLWLVLSGCTAALLLLIVGYLVVKYFLE